MKTIRIFKLMGMVLIGLLLTIRVEANVCTPKDGEKKVIELSVDKLVKEFISKAYADQIDAKDIVRIQKVLGQIDHITISFRDEDACDYVLKFKSLDEQQLEDWMFDEGYLSSDYKADDATVVPWMQNMHLD